MGSLVDRMDNNNARQEPGPISLQDFVRLNPVTFCNSSNPLDADDWRRDITFEMESANVAPASYVTFAMYHLKGSAAQLWESHTRMLPAGTVTTWIEFQAAFRAHHIPQGLMDQKKKEFRNLTRGKKTVDEYQREFLNLSRYAEDDVSTDMRKQDKFCEGLDPVLKHALSLHEYTDFPTLINKAIQAETSLAELQESLKRTRDVGSSSAQSTQKHRVWIPHNVYHRATLAPRPSYVAPHLPPPPKQLMIQGGQSNAMAPCSARGACHKCGQPGHHCQILPAESECTTPSAPTVPTPDRLLIGRIPVNHVKDRRICSKHTNIMMGNLPANSVAAYVLFDSGASYSFMSEAICTQLHDMPS